MSLKIFSTDWLTALISKGSLVTTTTMTAATKTRWQRKTMSSSNTPSQLNFNGLEIGKTYSLSFYVVFTGCSAGADLRFYANFGTDSITYSDDNVGGGEYRFYFEKTFVADASTVVFAEGSGGTRTLAAGCYATLKELPNHEVTTAWT